MHLQLYRNDEYYAEGRNRFSDLYASLAQTEPVVVPSLREAFAYSDATKAVIVADAPDAERYAEKLRREFDGRAYVTRSLPEFVEVLDPTVDKGDALAFVASRLGVSMRDVVADRRFVERRTVAAGRRLRHRHGLGACRAARGCLRRSLRTSRTTASPKPSSGTCWGIRNESRALSAPA